MSLFPFRLRHVIAPIRELQPFEDRGAALYRRLTGRARRTWVGNGRAHIEYRPVAGDQAEAFHEGLAAALDGVAPVSAVSVNPYVGRVVVTYEPDAIDVAGLTAVIEAVEDEFGVGDDAFPADRPDHPGDVEPPLRELVQLLAALGGIGGSLAGRVSALVPGRGPRDLSWLLTLLENVPQLRSVLERHVGGRTTDLALGLTNSVLRAVNLGLTGHVVDVVQRVTRIGELGELRDAWEEREPALATAPPRAADPGRPTRPVPVRDGPVERYADRAWRLSLGGFAASVVATDDVERSVAPLLDGIPKAARLGRAVFCSQLSRVLAQRGCLVLDPHVLSLLDRVEVVVVEAAVLGGADDDDGPTSEGQALLRAARSADLTVLVAVDHDDQLADVDGRVPAAEVDERLVELQSDGAAVLAVGATGAAAFRRADVRVGLQPDGHPPAWDADVLCGEELADALLVIRAVSAARRNSNHAVMLATAGAGIGAMTAFGGLTIDSGRQVLRSVDGAAMLAMGNGIRLAAELATIPGSLRHDATPWHELAVDEVLERLGTSVDGLDHETWAQRHTPPATPPPAVVQFAQAAGQELANPITPVLAGGAALSLATGSMADAGLVGSVIALNAAIGGAQRYRAERALEELYRSGQHLARTVRGGREEHVPVAELVPGDVFRVGPGEAVPADARLLEARGLEVDESSLTGESLPVGKQTAVVVASAVADRASMLYEGTTVAAGEALAVVVAVGEDTEARRAMTWAVPAEGSDTGVESRLDDLTRTTIPLAMVSAAGLSLVGLVRGVPTRELMDASIGLAVAAVPEGLPLLASAAQRAAAKRLSKHRVLVRDPRAIEALGRVDVLCADKTGTLTEGRIRLAVVSDGETSSPAGEGGPGHDAVLLAARRATPIDPDVERLPHPTDEAVAQGTRRIGVRRQDGGDFDVLDDLPFEPDRSYHAVLAETDDGRLLSLKGAPEAVLARSVTWQRRDGSQPLDAATREDLAEEAERLAAQGLRVLAVAERPFDGDDVADDDVAELAFIGFVGLRDPVRPVSKDSIERLRRAGVDVIMITGDHPTTAHSIAEELGLANGRLLTGPDIDALDDRELGKVLPEVTVFARVTPLHKVRVVRAFQELGRTVAMTGDGANDAPAIRLADVGIAVGERATAAARQTADVVIMEDRLEVIVDAIAEGRGLWGSVRDAVSVLVGGNLGEISFMLLGSVVGRRPPLNTRQLLLVNLLTDVAPAMALAVRAPRASVEELLAEGPERSLGDELNEALVWRGTGAATGATMAYAMARLTGSLPRARTAGLVALVGAQLGQTVATSRGDVRVLATGLGSFAAMAGMVQTPGMSRLVGCRPMGPVGWLTGAAGAVAGSAIGVAGPWLEEAVTGEPGGWSRAVVERLVGLAPEIPGLTSSS